MLDRRIQDTVSNDNGLLLVGYSEDVLQNVTPPTQPIVGYFGHRGGTIYQGLVYGQTSMPKLPVLASPIVAGHRWWTDAGGIRDSFEIVNVSNGQFNFQPIDTIVIVKRWNVTLVDSTWFGRTIGLMQQRSLTLVGKTVRTLRSFTAAP